MNNKVVLRVELSDDKIKTKAMKAVSQISGVESVSVDMKDQKLTLMGDVDPVRAVAKLRKLCQTEILSVGPANIDQEKKKEPKKDEKKKSEEKVKDKNENKVGSIMKNACDCQSFDFEVYHPHHQMRQPHYYYTSVEENPNACVIS